MSSVETLAPTAFVARLFERINEHDTDFVGELAAADVAEVWPVVGALEGRAAVADHFAAIFAAAPDFRIQIEKMAADDETVFVHWRATGTFTGSPFLGIEATGRRFELRGTDCMTIRDGRVAENFVAYDGMTFAVQVGVMPPHGSALDRAMALTTNLVTRVRRRVRGSRAQSGA